MQAQVGLPTRYNRWLDETIAVLTEGKYLRHDAYSDSVTALVSIDSNRTWQEWEQQKAAWLADPDLKARVVLVEATLRALPEILAGRVPATDILFPHGSMELLAGIYKHNRIADLFNGTLADAVVAYLHERRELDGSARLRILEIGAGTGGTSALIFQKLLPYQEYIQEYCYTDLSQAFLQHAEQTYGPKNPYLTYRIFNVEESLADQGISPGSYDLVIAANVLHATRNIRQTLRNAKAILKRHGWLLLHESSHKSLFLHLTFGLLEGWWLYEDTALRLPGCPLLASATWQAILEQEGFHLWSFPTLEASQESTRNSLYDQQTLVAESNGCVWQRHVQPATKFPHNNGKHRNTWTDVTDQMLKDHVRSIILESLAEVLKVQERVIQEDKSFSAYGVDSIVAVNLINVINKKSQLTLPTTVLFDNNNIEQLLHYILREHTATLRAILQEHMLDENSEVAAMQDPWSIPNDNTQHMGHPIRRDSTRPLSARNSQWKRLPMGSAKGLHVPRAERTSPESLSGTPPMSHREPLAIIGMSCRFARSKNVNDLWEHLANGTDLVEEVSRWDLTELSPVSLKKKEPYCKHGSFLAGIDLFDPLFFNISGLEATYMDPQQRLVLEEAWKALEDAGYAGTSIEGRQCGVYMGCAAGDYKQLFKDVPPAQAFWGNAGSVIPARIAYHLNLQGPAIAIDTACSSSLVAMHLACQGLWSGEIDMALAGGVFLQCTPQFYQSANRAGMLSVTGCCSTFDDRANGFVPGEGVGIVVLKRLKDALASGDHISAVIRGSGINQDGATRGITVPSANSQERLMRSVYETFQIEPAQIQMVEAHGTGTKLGDPIEFEALTRTFRRYTEKKEYCALGSIKTNLGHTAAAAGVAGVIKLVLSLQHKQIPPSLHFASGNAHIQFNESPFYVNTRLKDWEVEADGIRRCAALSSFGFSGTNAHMVIEEAPERSRRHAEKPGYLIVLSARTQDQLRQQVEQLVTFCERDTQLDDGNDCGNMSYTLLLGRQHLKQRLACIVRDYTELRTLLGKWLEKGKVPQVSVSNLENREQVENTSLRRYGNQCIEDCQRWARSLVSVPSSGSRKDIDSHRLPTERRGSALRLPTPHPNESSGNALGINRSEVPVRVPTSEMYLEQLSTVADLYLQGYTLAFERLFAGEEYSRISLPTYPFARERYWIPTLTVETERDPYPLPTISSTAAVTSPSPGGSVHLPSSGASPLLTAQHETGAVGTVPYARPVPTTQDTRSSPCPGQAQVLSTPMASRLEEELARSLAQALYVEQSTIDVEKAFVDMGMDSIIGVEWIQSINKQYTINLAATRVYDYPTIRQLASFLEKELLKLGRGIQQTPVQSVPSLSHDDSGAIGTVPDTHLPISSTYQRVIVERVSGIDDLIIGEAEMPEVKDHEVRVAVRAFSLNFGDLLCVKGLYPTMPPYPFTPGFEASGVVLEVGRAVTAFQSGDPVIVLAGAPLGAHASVMTSSEEYVFHKPTTLSFEEACALPVVAITMVAAFEKARLKRGEKILIHTATGGTGLIAIQLANYYQAQIYATAGSQFKLDYLEQLGVPYRINYQEMDFEKEIKRLTEGKGIDVVINTLSGDAMQKGMNCLAPGGRYIEIAMTALKSARTIDLSIFNQNQTFYSVDLRKLAQSDPATLKRYCHAMFQLVEEGIITPTICQVFTWERLKDAYRYLENRQNIGKIVVRIPEASPVSHTAPESRLQARAASRKEAIAIVGMSGKYPGASNLTEYWDNLVQGKNAIREIPLARFDISHRYDPDPAALGKISCKWLGALEDIEYFDSLFFHISPIEAEGIDPQHRLFLEEGYKTLEDAGYSPRLLSNRKCGVYLGIASHEYSLLLSQQKTSEMNLFGISPAIAAARLAYLLNLKGPAIPIDTACSSSLVAMHLACQALRQQEIAMALVGGVSLCLTSDFYISMCSAGMLSPDGQCKTFDASANGFVPGEGIGALVLKRLADAEADHDQIYGVIIGSGINQDGATNGITAPSVNSQIDLEREIYEKYQIDPESISYIEMHGTGTKLGDPIELEALSTVFQEKTQRKQYCAVGSVKTNIGHTLAAAGVAGVQKVLLAMQRKKLVPSLHFQRPNEHFDFTGSPFYVNTAVQDWKADVGIPRRAAVSSFGFSGTNAHVIIEEYIPRRDAEGGRRDGACPRPEAPILFILSAKSEQQLKSYAQDMQRWIQAHPELALEDIAFTLQLGREAMEYRLAILADSHGTLLQRLADFVDNQTATGVYTAQVKKSTLGSPPIGSDGAHFAANEDGQSLPPIWFQMKNLARIAQAWVNGVYIDWMLLYSIDVEQAQGKGAVGTELIPAHLSTPMPYRVSLPTYPFAHKRHWFPTSTIETRRVSDSSLPTTIETRMGSGSSLPTDANPQPSGSAPVVTAPTPVPSVRLSSVEQDTPAAQGTQSMVDKANGNGQTARIGTVKVALRPLVSVPSSWSRKDIDSRRLLGGKVYTPDPNESSGNTSGIVPCVDPAPPRADPAPPRSSSIGTSPQAAQGPIPTVAPQLEEELARSLAQALYMEQSDIDMEKPFGEIGLDSVIGIEWIQSLNKQYACSLKASIVYDHPTIRELAGFLQEALLKQGGGMQQTPVQSTPSLSLDDMLRQVQQRNLEPEKAEQLLQQLFLQNHNGKSGTLYDHI